MVLSRDSRSKLPSWRTPLTKKVGVPPDATLNAVKQVTLDLACVEVLRHVLSEEVGFETESGGVLVQMCIFFDAEIERAVL
jgi:hypothetical protein